MPGVAGGTRGGPDRLGHYQIEETAPRVIGAEVGEDTADRDWVELGRQPRRSWGSAYPPGPDPGSRSAAPARRASGRRRLPRAVPRLVVSVGDDDLETHAPALPGGSLTAPMPASVLRVDVEPGDAVAAGQILAMLEAMKIQVQVAAPGAGTVRAVRVRAGDIVARGDTLIELEEG